MDLSRDAKDRDFSCHHPWGFIEWLLLLSYKVTKEEVPVAAC